MDSRKFGSAALAMVSVADEYFDVLIKGINAFNKQRPGHAAAMAVLLEQALGNLEDVVEEARPKTLAERYEAFPEGLKKKLALENGRFYFEVTGSGLHSEKWPERLKGGGHELTKWAKDVLSKPDYNKNHLLKAGKVYKLGLVFGTEFANDPERSTANVQAFARRELGEQATGPELKGELALLIREKFTNAELEVLGLLYIAVLHSPIVDSDGDPRVLYAGRNDGSYVFAYYVFPESQWGGNGAFAFPAR